jgi:bacteriocin-like protein
MKEEKEMKKLTKEEMKKIKGGSDIYVRPLPDGSPLLTFV